MAPGRLNHGRSGRVVVVVVLVVGLLVVVVLILVVGLIVVVVLVIEVLTNLLVGQHMIGS